MEKNTEQNRIEEIAAKWLSGKVSAEEQIEFNAWFKAGNELPFEIAEEYARSEDEHKMKIWNVIQTQLTQAKQRDQKTTTLWPQIRIAVGIAAAVATIIFGVWFFTSPDHDSLSLQAQRSNLNDIAPGHSGATITYSNGEVIQLDSTKTGVNIDPTSLTYNDGTVIKSGTRDLSQGRDDGKALEMTASTSKGQTYVFTLPDGTKVWLNAATTLKFPSTFANAKTRNVEVSGEAYFEVFRDKSQPFVVKTKKLGNIPEQEITVLGTHFNVNSYADEGRVATTLLEGSVRVSSYATASSRANVRDLLNNSDKGSLLRRDDGTLEMARILKPNEQALNNQSGIKVVPVAAASYADWISGEFYFEKESIESIMRKVARWYDVEIHYEGAEKPGRTFSGTVSRYDQLSKMLNLIHKSEGIVFKVEGRKVTVFR